MSKPWWRLAVLGVVLALASAQAAGFSVRGAVDYNLSTNKLGLEGEVEYSDKLDANLTWGVRLSLQKVPLDSDLILIAPNAFAEYRIDLEKVSVYGKLELGIGWLPQFFPRVVLSAGADRRAKFNESMDYFSQASVFFDFIITNRAKLGANGRAGLIVIPFVPYLGAEASQDFYPGTFNYKIFAGSLLYLSPQFFLGLEGGIGSRAYLRLAAQFSER